MRASILRLIARSLIAILLVGVNPSRVVAAPPFQGQTEHVVQPGETLFRIAQAYGVTVDDIVAANGLPDRDVIHVGQRLLIPITTAAPGVTVSPLPEHSTRYVVQLGDTLFLIAQRYGTTVEAIAQANGIVNPNLIVVGQSLELSTRPQSSVAQTTVHVVLPGETLARIALRYGTTAWAIAQANGLSNPNLIHVGQRLTIPGLDQVALLAPFTGLLLEPTAVTQGQTVVVHVSADREVSLSGSFDGRLVRFVGNDGAYWALIGVHAMAQPGLYPLELAAVDAAGNITRITQGLQVSAGQYPTDYITLPPGKGDLLDPVLLQQEQEKLTAVFGGYRGEKLWQGLLQAPVENPRITSSFGSRRSYDGGPATSYHAGVDFGGAEGTPVYAPAAGVVVLAEPLTVRGNAVIVDHGLGVFTGYWHLAGMAVEVGQSVVPGSLLGYIGNTGLSTGAHLHWELRIGNIAVDPMQWTEQAFP
ncbi:MAG: LysM peptidoglycan-binding domain-containing protein [Chloroflexota bacterium]